MTDHSSMITRDADGVFMTVTAAGGGGGDSYSTSGTACGGGGGGAGASATFFINARKHFDIFGTAVACKITLGSRGNAASSVSQFSSTSANVTQNSSVDANQSLIDLYETDRDVGYTIKLGGGYGGGDATSTSGGPLGMGGIVKFRTKGVARESIILDHIVEQDTEYYYIGDGYNGTAAPENRVPNNIRQFFRLICVSDGQNGGKGEAAPDSGRASSISNGEKHMLQYNNYNITATHPDDFEANDNQSE